MATVDTNGSAYGSLRLTVGRLIRLERQRLGWSQEALAESANLNRTYVGSIERAEHNIGIDTLERLALALDITVCRLVGCVEPAPPRQQEV